MSWRRALAAFAYCGLASCVGNEPDGATPADAGGDGAVEVVPPGCDPTKEPKDEPCLVTESVGVFVSPTGDDGAEGTKSAPLRTIARGIERARAAGKQRLFVCEGTYAERVVLDPNAEGVRLFGGFACGAFAYSGGRPRVEAPDGGVALRIERLPRATTISDFDFVARDATAPGANSIAAMISGSESVVFRRVALIAGRGGAGAAGTTADNHFTGTRHGGHHTDPRQYRVCTCLDGTTSSGGARGEDSGSLQPLAGASSPNVAFPRANAGMNSGLELNCVGGSFGADGSGGEGGTAADTKILFEGGNLVRPRASAGKTGLPGQGGGGGGAKNASTADGSGGGCGGCGGGGGGPGEAGGSSVAVLVQQSAVLFFESSLAAGDGGNGGGGAVGQQAQIGGDSGTAHPNACYGGPGGRGGGGGGGAGGAGGHAIAILYSTATPPQWDGAAAGDAPALPRVTVGRPGGGGAGGAGAKPIVANAEAGAPGSVGPAGIAAAVRRLD